MVSQEMMKVTCTATVIKDHPVHSLIGTDMLDFIQIPQILRNEILSAVSLRS